MPPPPVSMESAMTSRATSEYFMPSLPMEIPSEMVMVLKTIALPPEKIVIPDNPHPVCDHPLQLPRARGTGFVPFSASSASLFNGMLHGVMLLQVDAMPMMLLKTSASKPTG